jgi:hypothetical protein
MLSGCASVPSNFKQRAVSEFSIDVKLHSTASHYYPGVYGFSDLKSNILFYSPQLINGILVCTESNILFVIPGREKYDIVLEIPFTDVSDVLTPAWGLNRRLLIKCKNQFYTFDFTKGGTVSKEETYFFYKVISQVSKGVSIDVFVREREEQRELELKKEREEKEKVLRQGTSTGWGGNQEYAPEKPNTSAPTTFSSGTTRIVTWDFSVVKSAPGSNYSSIATVRKGDKLTIMEQSGEWVKVRLENGQEGWVRSEVFE